MIRRVLVANRGEIALRIVRACHALGLEAVVAHSDADRDSAAVRLADRAVCIGPARPVQSYLRPELLLAAALGTGADAIHPGYGFLAENADFAQRVSDEGLVFVGPSAATIRTMGDKLAARGAARDLGVPLVPGSDEVRTAQQARDVVDSIGFPVIIKAAAGGGGRGIRVVTRPEDLEQAIAGARAEAEAAFGDGTLFVERYITDARHVEVQILADGHGTTLHLGERDCSLQRRYQKVVEEAPASTLDEATRAQLLDSAVRLAAGIGYRNAGTVEFVYDNARRELSFLEMNTRIQVEHPVSEMVTGLDLVELQLRVAAGEALELRQEDVVVSGHAIEARITAEDADAGFRPSPGRITRWRPPETPGLRLDSHCFEGYVVPPFYDSLLGKLIVHGPDRGAAIDRLVEALDRFEVAGVDTTIPFLRRVVDSPDFRAGAVSTTWIEASRV